MPRPARLLWVPRTYARRRHRSWMYSMTMATLGWGAWWTAFVVTRLFPSVQPGVMAVGSVACFCGALGLAFAALTVRARRTWLLFALVAMFANASLFAMPWLVRGLKD